MESFGLGQVVHDRLVDHVIEVMRILFRQRVPAPAPELGQQPPGYLLTSGRVSSEDSLVQRVQLRVDGRCRTQRSPEQQGPFDSGNESDEMWKPGAADDPVWPGRLRWVGRGWVGFGLEGDDDSGQGRPVPPEVGEADRLPCVKHRQIQQGRLPAVRGYLPIRECLDLMTEGGEGAAHLYPQVWIRRDDQNLQHGAPPPGATGRRLAGARMPTGQSNKRSCSSPRTGSPRWANSVPLPGLARHILVVAITFVSCLGETRGSPPDTAYDRRSTRQAHGVRIEQPRHVCSVLHQQPRSSATGPPDRPAHGADEPQARASKADVALECSCYPAAMPPATDVLLDRRQAADADQRVLLHEVSWKEFELLLAIRGDKAGVRMTFYEAAGDCQSHQPDLICQSAAALVKSEVPHPSIRARGGDQLSPAQYGKRWRGARSILRLSRAARKHFALPHHSVDRRCRPVSGDRRGVA